MVENVIMVIKLSSTDADKCQWCGACGRDSRQVFSASERGEQVREQAKVSLLQLAIENSCISTADIGTVQLIRWTWTKNKQALATMKWDIVERKSSRGRGRKKAEARTFSTASAMEIRMIR